MDKESSSALKLHRLCAMDDRDGTLCGLVLEDLIVDAKIFFGIRYL